MAFKAKVRVQYKINLKNSAKCAVIDKETYLWLTSDSHFVEMEFLANLRLHSSGCVFFQKTSGNSKDGYITETIYLHKLIAEKFLLETKTKEKNLVGSVSGDKLDCRVENLEYRSRSKASRLKSSSSESGFKGVYKENNKYRAVISIESKAVHLGMYDTPEDAAAAYNQKVKELLSK